MFLTLFELNQFRNFQRCRLLPHRQLNVFVGPNGSGKSSILEAIYLFGFGRSFRTTKPNSLIQHETSQYSLFAKAMHSGLSIAQEPNQQDEFNAGIARKVSGEFECQLNGKHGLNLTTMVESFPIQLFTPQSTDLIIGTPGERRKFMDWGVFHVEHGSRKIYSKFSALLKHRNALLKTRSFSQDELNAWDRQFVEVSTFIKEKRQAFLISLIPVFEDILAKFLPEFILNIEYNAGWDAERDLMDLLQEKLSSDMQYGNTSIGPHKADIKVRSGRQSASEVLSRGQLRMAVAALQLAQTITYQNITKNESIFLLDDLGAELDEDKRAIFVESLSQSNSQIFVTAIEAKQLDFINNYDNKKMFHVEHGSVKEE